MARKVDAKPYVPKKIKVVTPEEEKAGGPAVADEPEEDDHDALKRIIE